MKRQKKMLLCLFMVLVTALTGCGKKSDFTVGTWNGTVFENSWLNMKFEVPKDWKIATQEEINEIVGLGAETLDIEGTSAEQLKAAAKLKTFYSFMVSEQSGTPSAILSYENLALTIGGTKYTESEYLDILSDMFLQQDAYDYEVVEKSIAEIANKTFQCLKLSAFEGALYQEYYCYKKDKFMVILILSYTPEQEDLKADFINNISTLE